LDVGLAKFSFAGQGRLGNFESGFVAGRRILELGEDFFFDGEFAGVGELEAVAGKNFDAVVGPGIVRGGDDDAGGHAAGARQKGDSGSGDDAGAVHVDADGGETLGDAVGDPAAGFASVLADDGLGAPHGAHQVVAEGAADEIGAWLGEREFSGYAADAVGSE
jgi:hypothetical protein